ARTSFAQRTARAAIDSAILDPSRKSFVQVIRANGQVVGSQEYGAVSFDRSSRHTRSIVTANVQVAVAENQHLGRAAGGSSSKLNRTAVTSVQTAVGNQYGVVRIAGVVE